MGKWSHLVGKYPEKKTAIKDLKQTYSEMQEEELEEKVAELYRERKDKERELGLIKAKYEAASEALVEMWKQSGTTGRRRSDIGTLAQYDNMYANITNKAEFKEWAQKHGMGYLLQETVNAQTLSSTVKELLEDGNPIPPGVNIHTKSVIRPTSSQKEDS